MIILRILDVDRLTDITEKRPLIYWLNNVRVPTDLVVAHCTVPAPCRFRNSNVM
jgi:hypothetical protein